MTNPIFSRTQIGLLGLGSAALVSALGWQWWTSAQLRDDAIRRAATTETALRELQTQVARETKHAAEAEARVNALLQEAKSELQAARASSVAPTDVREVLKASLERASKLIAQGEFAGALDEYLGSYRELRAKRPGSPETQTLMGAIVALGRRYPEALPALAKLRDSALEEWTKPKDRASLAGEIALLNEQLNAGERTLAIYDTLPAGDPIRRTLAMIAQKSFVKARRYADALEGRSFAQMMLVAENIARRVSPLEQKNAGAVRSSSIATMTTDLEVLIGAGKADEARQLTEMLLAYDSSDTIRAAIEQAKTRALAPR